MRRAEWRSSGEGRTTEERWAEDPAASLPTELRFTFVRLTAFRSTACRPTADRLTAGRSAAVRLTAGRSEAVRLTAGRSAAVRFTACRWTAFRPAADRLTGARSTAGRSLAVRSTGARSTAGRSAALRSTACRLAAECSAERRPADGVGRFFRPLRTAAATLRDAPARLDLLLAESGARPGAFGSDGAPMPKTPCERLPYKLQKPPGKRIFVMLSRSFPPSLRRAAPPACLPQRAKETLRLACAAPAPRPARPPLPDGRP